MVGAQRLRGTRPPLYAVGDDGHALGTFTLTGATNVDWEDIAVGPGPIGGTSYVFVADIGSISQPFVSTRPSVDVYRVPEPAVSSTVSSGAVSLGGAEKLTFTYPGDAKYDAESLIVDPVTGKLYIVTKELVGREGVHRAGEPHGRFDDRARGGRDLRRRARHRRRRDPGR